MRNMWSCQIFQNPFYRGKEECQRSVRTERKSLRENPVVGSDGIRPDH
jgi:hypothetical protein